MKAGGRNEAKRLEQEKNKIQRCDKVGGIEQRMVAGGETVQ
jgi:hypothetical protein